MEHAHHRNNGDDSAGGISLPTEEQFEKLHEYVVKSSAELREIEDALEASVSEVWDAIGDVVAVRYEAEEQCETYELVRTDNDVVGKVLVALTAVSNECAELQRTAEERFYSPLACFGERFDDGELPEGEEAANVAALLPLLEDLSHFVQRCHAVVANGVEQLCGLYSDKSKYFRQTFRGAQMQAFLASLGDLLRVLVTLDAIVEANSELNTQWAEYKRMLQSAALEPEIFGMNPRRIGRLLMAVMRLETELFAGAMYRGCVMQDFRWRGEDGKEAEARSNKTFVEEVLASLRAKLVHLSGHLCTQTEANHRQLLVGFVGLYVLMNALNRGRDLDSKLYKAILALRTKVPVVPVYGRAIWSLADFIYTHMPSVGKPGKDNRVDFIRKMDESTAADVQALHVQACAWMVRMESNFSQRVTLPEVLSVRGNLLIQGVLLAFQISNVAKLSLGMHMHYPVPLKQSTLRPLYQCAQLLKALQYTYFRKSAMISDQILHMQRFMQSTILRILMPIRSDLETQLGTTKKGGWKQEESKLDMLALVTVMCANLRGPNTAQRRAAISFAWDLCPKKWIREADKEEINLILRKLDILGRLERLIKEACDTSFLFWSRGLVPLFLADCRGRWQETHQLHFLMAALRDGGELLQSAGLGADRLYEQYQKYLLDALEGELVEPLCREIETDLRLRIHSAQIAQIAKSNPMKEGSRDLSTFVNMRPLRVLGEYVDVKCKVAQYLDATFYNLTAVATNDWKTYGEMRNLAQAKYGLHLTESYLPVGTLEQGLDVLEIMRNINVFVSRYTYHMHTQVFVEKPGVNKYINTIGIQQVANSIRTHGTGIMNTTVNYTYQYLTRRFAVLSQFLFDDHIKSRLMKDAKFFRDGAKSLKNRYPYERAQSFNVEIRRLGVDSEGRSYLDKFRILVTEIGNVLGYVRLIRAGGLNHTSGAVGFIPDLSAVDHHRQVEGNGDATAPYRHFSNAAQGQGLSKETEDAFANLDDAIDDLTVKFSQGTDFFKLLVDVFAGQLRGEDQSHLANFFVIVPPLTINFVDHMLASKDKLIKGKRQIAGAFCDDGFMLGVAYILRVLGQNGKFDSLHWFESVNMMLRSEGKELDVRRVEKKRATDDEMQTLQLALGRLKARQVENDLVYFTLSGACVLFKS